MATHPIAAPAATVTYLPFALAAARVALVARIDKAAERAMYRCSIEGMPFHLVSASCFLAAQGVDEPACRGEFYFNWPLATSRRFLIGLDSASREQEVEAGRKALFDGPRAIVKANNLSDAWDAMADAFGTDDGTFEAARARFQALNAELTAEVRHG